MKNGWTSYEGNSYYYQDGTAYTGFVWCTTMLAMAGWFETKLWNGRIINIILDQMENIFPIPGVIIEEATQPQMVHLYAAEWKQIDGKQYYLAGEASFNHIIYMFLLMKGVYTKEGEYLLQDNYAQVGC